MAPSPALSILAKAAAAPTLQGRKVGALVSDGVDGTLVEQLEAALDKAGAKLELIGPKVGGVTTAEGDLIPVDHRIDGGPSVMFDAVAVLAPAEGAAQLAMESAAVDFLRDAYAHLKVIGHLPSAAPLFARSGLSEGDADEGVVALDGTGSVDAFVAAAAKGRVWDREPKVRVVA
jgi:catalase